MKKNSHLLWDDVGIVQLLQTGLALQGGGQEAT